MKRTFSAICLFVLLVVAMSFMQGCGTEKGDNLQVVCILDLTRSIDPESQKQAFDALKDVVKGLKRGDSLSIIPITSDAATQAQGNIYRIQISKQRKAYNADVKEVLLQLDKSLEKLQESAQTYNKSDVLGTISIAAEEFSNTSLNGSTKSNTNKIVIILSDFIQDNSQYNFKKEEKLSNEQSAKELAYKLADSDAISLCGTKVYLGLLRSTDMKNLSQKRQMDIKNFWIQYFNKQGASNVDMSTDGPGKLSQLFANSNN